MDREPKRLLTRLVEAAFLFALSAWLIHLGVSYLLCIGPALAILGGIALAIIILCRIRKHRKNNGL